MTEVLTQQTMTALRKLSHTAGDVALVALDVPQPGQGQVLVRTEAVGLCGSDVHAVDSDSGYQWLPDQVTLGHEAVGRIVATGDDVGPHRVGERVVPLAIDGCRHCEVCRSGATHLCPSRDCLGLSFDGALADYFVVDAHRLVAAVDDLPAVVAALTEPAAVAAHAVSHLSTDLSGRRVVVSGPGPIGLLSALFAADAGAKVELVGPDFGPQQRLEFAEQLGIHTVRGHERLETELPIDAWIDSTGAARVLEAAVQRVRYGATIVVPGLFGAVPRLDMNAVVRGEVRAQGTYGYTAADYATAGSLLQRYRQQMNAMVTTFGFDQSVEAIAETAATNVIKAVVLTPDQEATEGTTT